jgi:hypothetical protein
MPIDKKYVYDLIRKDNIDKTNCNFLFIKNLTDENKEKLKDTLSFNAREFIKFHKKNNDFKVGFIELTNEDKINLKNSYQSYVENVTHIGYWAA